jgi:hypothetical protein
MFSISPLPPQVFNNNGKPGVGYKLRFFEGGSFSVPKPVYANSDGSVQLPNPVVADASGRVPAIWFPLGEVYNVTLSTPDETIVVQSWTNITSINAVAGATQLSQLTDVSVPSPSNGQVLTYSGSNWIASTPATASPFWSVGVGGGLSPWPMNGDRYFNWIINTSPVGSGITFNPSDGELVFAQPGRYAVSFAGTIAPPDTWTGRMPVRFGLMADAWSGVGPMGPLRTTHFMPVLSTIELRSDVIGLSDTMYFNASQPNVFFRLGPYINSETTPTAFAFAGGTWMITVSKLT